MPVIPPARCRAAFLFFFCAFCAAATPASSKAAEPTAAAVWLLEPILLDSSIDRSIANGLALEMQRALATVFEGPVVYGEAVREDPRSSDSEAQSKLLKAQALLAKGEEQYMDFAFAPAAASAAEAGGLFSAALGKLDPDNMARLDRARILEGICWLEAGHAKAALAAFAKLLRLHPDYEPEASGVPPHALRVFHNALLRVRSVGLATLSVRTEPAGAEVILDGKLRGRTPVNLPGVPIGLHQLRLVLAGYGSYREEISLLEGDQEISTTFRPSLPIATQQKIHGALANGESLDRVRGDLAAIATELQVRAIVLLGVAKRNGHTLLTATRCCDDNRAAVVVLLKENALGERARQVAKLLEGGAWPPVQLPQGSPPVVVDFTRAALGIGSDWGGQSGDDSGGLLSRPWFWAGASVVAAGIAAGIVLVSRNRSQTPDHTSMTLDFP